MDGNAENSAVVKGVCGASRRTRTLNNRSEVDCDIHFTMEAKSDKLTS